MGLIGDIVFELSFISAVERPNLVMALQGLYFAAFSLNVSALVDSTVPRTVFLNSSVRETISVVNFCSSIRRMVINYAPQVCIAFVFGT